MAEGLLSYEFERGTDEITVRLTGEFDLNTAMLFELDVVPTISDGWRSVVIDLSGLTFLDTSGLLSIVRAWQSLEERGVSAHLIRGGGIVDHVLTLSGLGSRFG